MQIADRTRELLSAATVTNEGPAALLTLPRLSRTDYLCLDKVLRNLGGKWDRRAKAHVFDANPSAMLAQIVETGQAPDSPRKAEGYVATPANIADELVAIAGVCDLDDGARVLEPSAGDGALVRAIQTANPAVQVHAIEPNTRRAADIATLGGVVFYGLTIEDYLHASDAVRQFDAVVMNPPFRLPGRSTAWIDHVRHAWRMLAPGGRLVALVPAGFDFRDDTRHRDIRAWHERYRGGRIEVDDSAFGGVRTRIIWADKPEGWSPEDDQEKKKRRRSGKTTTPEEQAARAAQKATDQTMAQDAADALDDPEFADLANKVLARIEPDSKLAAYSARNQAMVISQAEALGLRLTGDLHTIVGWRKLGRRVVKGSTALRVISYRGGEDAEPKESEPADTAMGDAETPERPKFSKTILFDRCQTEALPE